MSETAETVMRSVHVHVDNAKDIMPDVTFRTEEKYAEHFTCSTFTLPQGEIIGNSTGAVEPTQVLQLDPLRQRAVLSCNGSGQVILAHSMQQASSLAQNVQQAADEGALITCPATISVEATGPLWAVGVPSSNVAPVYGGAPGGTSGSVTGPAANGIIAETGSLTGIYSVIVTIYIDSTDVLATDDDNIELLAGIVTLKFVVPGSSSPGIPVQYIIPSLILSGNTITVRAITAASAAAVYHASIIYTLIGTAASGNAVQVGVVQERRNA
jgi:hypothetical protein